MRKSLVIASVCVATLAAFWFTTHRVSELPQIFKVLEVTHDVSSKHGVRTTKLGLVGSHEILVYESKAKVSRLGIPKEKLAALKEGDRVSCYKTWRENTILPFRMSTRRKCQLAGL